MPETDVVVLGSGAAGLSAALTAGVGGAAVTVLEGSPLFGGTSAVSGGGMWLPGEHAGPFLDGLLAGGQGLPEAADPGPGAGGLMEGCVNYEGDGLAVTFGHVAAKSVLGAKSVLAEGGKSA
jgi:hypothetical protein